MDGWTDVCLCMLCMISMHQNHSAYHIPHEVNIFTELIRICIQVQWGQQLLIKQVIAHQRNIPSQDHLHRLIDTQLCLLVDAYS